jgi:hypothetical protein
MVDPKKDIKKAPSRIRRGFFVHDYIYVLFRFIMTQVTILDNVITGLRDMFIIMTAPAAKTVLVIILMAEMP